MADEPPLPEEVVSRAVTLTRRMRRTVDANEQVAYRDERDALLEAHNRAIAERVREEHGDPHGANAHAFADFMGNHYAKRVEAASPAEREEFLEEYFRRNAWPTEAQRDAVQRSLRLVEEIAESA